MNEPAVVHWNTSSNQIKSFTVLKISTTRKQERKQKGKWPRIRKWAGCETFGFFYLMFVKKRLPKKKVVLLNCDYWLTTFNVNKIVKYIGACYVCL